MYVCMYVCMYECTCVYVYFLLQHQTQDTVLSALLKQRQEEVHRSDLDTNSQQSVP
jgi:hypothetical protein